MPKVLVADDNNNIQKMVALALEERGVQVTSVGNGEAAVRRIPDLAPDLILADIFMPVRNGYEVCEFVKKDQRFSQIPVVLLIGAFDPLDEKEARRVGADGVLKKPFVPPDPLIAMVLSILEKNPRAAEELKKFKEAKEAPEPHPLFESETAGKSAFASGPVIPTKIEPKPLPEYPEPSPEEAALIYGFGKGRRTLDQGQNGDAEEEQPAPHADAAETAEDDFDSASTAHDWRRNAMDFDIPADAANQPAFAATDNFDEPATAPSARASAAQQIENSKREEEQTSPFVEELKAAEVGEQPTPAPMEEASEPAPSISAQSIEPPATISQQDIKSPHTEEQAPPPADHLPVIGFESPHAPGPALKTPHWMDLVAGPAEPSQNEWVSRISKAQADDASTTEETSEASVQPATNETFFADSRLEQAPSFFASLPKIQPPVFEDEPGPLHVSSDAPQVFEKDEEAAVSPLFKDPTLVEPPAVRVTPEPLLVPDETQGSSGYVSRQHEDTQPLYSFVTQAPAVEESKAPEESAQTQAEEPAESEFNERIPTIPPPSREALAQIPFLTPPADFDPNAKHGSANEHNQPNESQIVDAVVQKVMERLEPQLHVLLSQGVLKPLVENLLQKELTKKEK